MSKYCAVAFFIFPFIIAQNVKATYLVLHDSVKHSKPYLGFYTKLVDCDGINIRSSDVVDDRALLIAAAKMKNMLKHIPEARTNLVANGAELHIIGKNQQTSDLPEFRNMKGVKYVDNGDTTDIDRRTRGLGGIWTSCGEENLLNLPGDRYAGGSDICIHEFAHNIMDYGLDTMLQRKIINAYKHALVKGLWKDAYATQNQHEYWAELSMWYFGKHGEFLKKTKLPVPGAESLRNYDNEGYMLMDSIYTGKLRPVTIHSLPAKQVDKNSKSGYGTEDSQLTFINTTGEKLELFWIDFERKPSLYGELQPYNRIPQPTHISHVWMVRNQKGEDLGYYVANSSYCSITILSAIPTKK
ncbi:hypothetical protein [Mucilaginibacter sp.]|uniref:VHL beta domain-containing protein n=1 Tax=Mucilaginibacter sp. TaxID=1882438 RepID=UPI0025E73860|nr:hypothetical protein [Mucilaginibacter sp.]